MKNLNGLNVRQFPKLIDVAERLPQIFGKFSKMNFCEFLENFGALVDNFRVSFRFKLKIE